MVEFGEEQGQPSGVDQMQQGLNLLKTHEGTSVGFLLADALEKLDRYAFNLAGPDFYPPGQTHMSGEPPNVIQRRENSATNLMIAIPQDEGSETHNAVKYLTNLQSEGLATVGDEIEGNGRKLLDALYDLTEASTVRDDSTNPECSCNGIALRKGVYLGTTVYFKELWERGIARSGEDVQLNYAFILGEKEGEKNVGALVSSDFRKIEEAGFKLNDLIRLGATHKTVESKLGVLNAARLAVDHSEQTQK